MRTLCSSLCMDTSNHCCEQLWNSAYGEKPNCPHPGCRTPASSNKKWAVKSLKKFLFPVLHVSGINDVFCKFNAVKDRKLLVKFPVDGLHFLTCKPQLQNPDLKTHCLLHLPYLTKQLKIMPSCPSSVLITPMERYSTEHIPCHDLKFVDFCVCRHIFFTSPFYSFP